MASDLYSRLAADARAEKCAHQVRLQYGNGAYLITSSKGDTDQILRRLKLYVKAGRQTQPGLVNRRKAEAKLFLA